MHRLAAVLFFTILLAAFCCNDKPETKAAGEKNSEITTDSTAFVNGYPGSSQILLVITDGWNDSRGVILFYERNGDSWILAADTIPAIIGRNGLGWAASQKGNYKGPIKREGDGRSPAGIFRITGIFGFAPLNESPGFNLPYTHITSVFECIDDSASQYYNAIVRNDTVAVKDWRRSEKMSRFTNAYEWGLTINFNTEPVAKGDGSCVFIHIWDESGGATAGCTSVSKENLLLIIGKLNSAKAPLLVQFPQQTYLKLRDSLALP